MKYIKNILIYKNTKKANVTKLGENRVVIDKIQ